MFQGSLEHVVKVVLHPGSRGARGLRKSATDAAIQTLAFQSIHHGNMLERRLTQYHESYAQSIPSSHTGALPPVRDRYLRQRTRGTRGSPSSTRHSLEGHFRR